MLRIILEYLWKLLNNTTRSTWLFQIRMYEEQANNSFWCMMFINCMVMQKIQHPIETQRV